MADLAVVPFLTMRIFVDLVAVSDAFIGGPPPGTIALAGVFTAAAEGGRAAGGSRAGAPSIVDASGAPSPLSRGSSNPPCCEIADAGLLCS